MGTAWKSLTKVSYLAALSPGDTVKFKRGGVWRGQLLPKNGSAAAYITYSDYGTGAKPLFLGSVNKSSTNDWISEGGNIWRSAQASTVDVGNLIFNGATSFGRKKWVASGPSGLLTQGDFWWDKFGTQTGKIYSTNNPASVYSDIEAAIGNHIVYEQLNSYIIFENLALKYGSANGFEIRNTHHTIIRDCDISYIGGSETGVQVRYGNAIQFWANSNDNTVERCKIWEIYDTGISPQCNDSGGAAQQYNLFYRNNLIWNCSLASVEIWVNAFGSSSSLSNIFFENNTCVNAGGGWGDAQRPDHLAESGAGSQVLFGHNSAITTSIFIRNNIFYKSRNILFVNNTSVQTMSFTTMDYNCWSTENTTDPIAVFYTPTSLTIWTNYQFDAYRTATNTDLHSFTADPLFSNPSTNDFHLTAGSPCRDTGINTGITVDFELTPVPQGGFYDVGADEFVGSAPVLSLAQSGQDLRLTWSSAPGELFTVHKADALLTPTLWTTLVTNWPASASSNTTLFTHTNAAFSQQVVFYRVGRQQ